MSHKGEGALDLKLKKGTKICAARAGIVTALRNDPNKGGLKQENLSDGNYITITHRDGSVAHYWHLQKEGVAINIGDTIITGQHIGFSGNTAYSAFPHLHFEVQGVMIIPKAMYSYLLVSIPTTESGIFAQVSSTGGLIKSWRFGLNSRRIC